MAKISFKFNHYNRMSPALAADLENETCNYLL